MTHTIKFSNYPQLADYLFNEIGLKVETVYVSDGDYSPYAIYINRIGNYNKAKFRVLKAGKDKVKNCLKITYNPDKWDREYLSAFIQSKSFELSHLAVGTCHKFLRHSEVKEVLTGVWRASTQNGATLEGVAAHLLSLV